MCCQEAIIDIQFQFQRELNVAVPRKLKKWVIKKFDEEQLETSFLTFTCRKEDGVHLRGAERLHNPRFFLMF